jgi:zinc protease
MEEEIMRMGNPKTVWFLLAMFLGISTVGIISTNATEKPNYKYAIVVKETTLKDEAWGKVVNALKEKHNAQVFTYQNEVNEVKDKLADYFPKYICFVSKPLDASREFVGEVHRLTRQLDADPYGDSIWAILTGYDAEDALRIAKHKEPLIVKYGLGGTLAWIDRVKEGIAYFEGMNEKGRYMLKKSDSEKVEDRKDGPTDSCKPMVDLLNKNKVDAMWTSGHATEHDWMIYYPQSRSKFISSQGKLYGQDSSGNKYEIKSTNPKVYLGAGNCLIGHIADMDCMALAWIHSGGVYQFLGYTVPTGYGYMGWGTGDYFFRHNGKFSLAESFYIINQALLFNLEKGLVKEARDLYGHTQNDKDTVVLYGDPAWEARVATGKDVKVPKSIWETDIKEKEESDNKKVFELIIKFNTDVDFDPISSCRPVFAFTPSRLQEAEIIDKGDAEAIEITDNFIIVKYKGKVEKNSQKKVTFKAKVLNEDGK